MRLALSGSRWEAPSVCGRGGSLLTQGGSEFISSDNYDCRRDAGSIEMNAVSPKIQNQIAMIQQVQQQLGTVIQQKAQFEMMAKETRKAEAELGGISDDSDVYVTIGTVMMKQDREKVLADLAEKTETFELRIKSLEKQEKALTTKFEQLQAQIKGALEGAGAPSAN